MAFALTKEQMADLFANEQEQYAVVGSVNSGTIKLKMKTSEVTVNDDAVAGMGLTKGSLLYFDTEGAVTHVSIKKPMTAAKTGRTGAARPQRDELLTGYVA